MAHRALALMIVCGLTGPWGATVIRAAQGPRPAHVHFALGPEHNWVSLAVEGAAKRLNHSDCREVLADFVDSQGQSLSAVLVRRGQTVNEYLHDVWFLDGSGQHACARRDTDAFTVPGSRLIFMCPGLFRRPVGRHQEILVIHEILHTLGLGENPPSSESITRHVEKRCGGV